MKSEFGSIQIKTPLKGKKVQFVQDLLPGSTVHDSFLVKMAQVGQGKNGRPFMNLVLCDRTGEIEARVWEDVPEYAGVLIRDAFAYFEGNVKDFQGRRQLTVKSARLLREDEVEPKEYLSPLTLDIGALWADLDGLVASMRDPHYKAIVAAVLIDDREVREKLSRAPAAVSVHHAYPGGLLEHMVSIGKLLDKISSHYGEILNRDLLFLGGFFHDIAKLWELQFDKSTTYTDSGRLIGHLVMGVELISQTVTKLEADTARFPEKFPEEKILLAKHMIVSHHGQLEYGSPKRPKCLEALVVHMVDDLDSKVNLIHRFIEADPNPGSWTALNKHLERYFYKPESMRKSFI